MDRKLKRWELALMFGILVAVVTGSWLGQEQNVSSAFMSLRIRTAVQTNHLNWRCGTGCWNRQRYYIPREPHWNRPARRWRDIYPTLPPPVRQ